MRKTIFLFYTFLFVVASSSAQVKLQNLLTENLTNPIGIDVQQPRFSWQLVSDQRNVTQTAYEINVTEGKNSVWKSGKVMSDQSVHVPYGGSALLSGKKYTWQVRVLG
jgi:alpha-L-rhamnosidase